MINGGGYAYVEADFSGGGGGGLEKALRYRLLNEPLEAESICLDVLQAEPANQEALVTLVLARTDLFDERIYGRV